VKQGVRIIFEDRWLIVVDKSSGLLSVAAGGKEETAYRLVTDYVDTKSSSFTGWTVTHPEYWFSQKTGKPRTCFRKTGTALFLNDAILQW